MKLLFEDDLVEAAVFLRAASRHPPVPDLLIRRFHRERERCYGVLDPDERNTAFARLHMAWFKEWGFEQWLVRAADEFSPLRDGLDTLAFRKARAKNDEGAELYRNPDGKRQGMVALRPDRFADEPGLTRLLHHELQHLSDMVDPEFGYSPDLARAGQTTSQQRLVRERYRLLWNVTVDGRLRRRGLETLGEETGRRAEFERGFAFLPPSRREELFDGLWHGRLARHDELLGVALDPRELHQRQTQVPGALCPLCGFAAFQWADRLGLHPLTLARIRKEYPAWHPEEGLCMRCAEIYESAFGLELPPTVCL